MPRPYPDSAKRENFCGGWDFQKAHPPGGPQVSNYHSGTDSIETLDTAFMAELVKSLAFAVEELAHP